VLRAHDTREDVNIPNMLPFHRLKSTVRLLLEMQLLDILLLTATAVQAHCKSLDRYPTSSTYAALDTFPPLVVNGKAEEKDWSATRQIKNANTKQSIKNPTTSDIRCYTSTNATHVETVPAGATIHYLATQQINHPGPTQHYLARVLAGADVKSWDGSGAVSFKFSTTKPSVDAQKQMAWPG
jgi:hypothetical protein